MAVREKGCSYRPLEDRVIVELHEAEEKSPGGIILPDNAKPKPRTGKVVSVGPGRILDSGMRCVMSVEPGDTVVFGAYAGEDLDAATGPLKVMREGEILAVLKR